MTASRLKRPQPKTQHDDGPDGDEVMLPRNALRAKRKGKDKLADVVVEEPAEEGAVDLGEPEEQEEEQGVTRCICGKSGML